MLALFSGPHAMLHPLLCDTPLSTRPPVQGALTMNSTSAITAPMLNRTCPATSPLTGSVVSKKSLIQAQVKRGESSTTSDCKHQSAVDKHGHSTVIARSRSLYSTVAVTVTARSRSQHSHCHQSAVDKHGHEIEICCTGRGGRHRAGKCVRNGPK